MSHTLRINEYPLECGPDEGIPYTYIPSRIASPKIRSSRESAKPITHPERSHSSAVYIPGISAISPPTKATLAMSHPATIPLIIEAEMPGMYTADECDL